MHFCGCKHFIGSLFLQFKRLFRFNNRFNNNNLNDENFQKKVIPFIKYYKHRMPIKKKKKKIENITYT